MKNTKTFVTIMAAVLLAAMMVFASCSQPTDGDPGSPGGPGNTGGVVLNSTAVTAAELAAVFAVSPTAILGSTAETVYGEIPAGKTLIVAGDAAVADDATLDVEGALEIRPSASLNASGLSGVGTLVFSGGTVLSNGTIQVDLAQAGELAAFGGTGVKAVGLDDFDGLGDLEVSPVYLSGSLTVDGEAATAIEAYLDAEGRTLYLGNVATVSNALDLDEKAGELVINGAYPAATYDLTASDAGNITVKGILSVSTATLAGKFDLTDGGLLISGAVGGTPSFADNRIKTLSSETSAASIALTGVTRIDTVTAGASAALTISAVADPFSIGAISGSAAVTLGEDAVLTIAAGETLEIDTATLVAGDTTLSAGTYTAAGGGSVTLADDGVLTINGTLTGEVSIETTEDGYALTTGNLAKLPADAEITYTDAQTGPEDDLVIPAGVSVTSAGTLEDITGLTIEEGASLTASAATLAAATSLSLGEGVELDVSDAGTLAALTGLTIAEGAKLTVGNSATFGTLVDEDVSGEGILILTTQDFSADALAPLLNIENVTSAATTITAEFTVPAATTLTLTAAAVPDENVTVEGALVIEDGGSLTIAAEKELVYDGAVTIEAGGSLILAAGDSTNSSISGTGAITAGLTEITGGWETDSSAASTKVTILSAATGATITASGANITLKGSDGGDGTITQAAGAGNSLKIAATTAIDLADAGSIVLKVASNGGSINLSAATAKIIGLTGGIKDRDLTADNLPNATFEVGEEEGKVKGSGESGEGKGVIAGGATGTNPITAKDGTTDQTIDKETLVGTDNQA